MFELFDEEGTGFITFKSLKRVCEELNESLYGEFIGDPGRICDVVSLDCHILAARLPLLFFLSYILIFSALAFRQLTSRPPRARAARSITATAHSTAEEVQEMIDEADRDNDGKINQREFLRIMKKRGDNPLDDLSSDED